MKFNCSHLNCGGLQSSFDTRGALYNHEVSINLHPCFNDSACATCKRYRDKGKMKQTQKKNFKKDLPCRHDGCPHGYSQNYNRERHERNYSHKKCLPSCVACGILREKLSCQICPMDEDNAVSLEETLRELADRISAGENVALGKRKYNDLDTIRNDLFVVKRKTRDSPAEVIPFNELDLEWREWWNHVSICVLDDTEEAKAVKGKTLNKVTQKIFLL